MLTRMTNKTIPLGLHSIQLHKFLATSIQVLEMENGVHPRLLSMPRTVQRITLGVAWFPFFIGTCFRLIFYKYAYEQYKTNEFKAVNKLTLVVSLAQHLNEVLVAVTQTIMVLNDDSLDHLVGGKWFCIAEMLVQFWCYAYSCVGSFGISVYRIILIKSPRLLAKTNINKVIANAILFGGIILTTIVTIIKNSHDYDQLQDDTCMFVYRWPVFSLLDEYEQSRGNPSIMEYLVKVHAGVGLCLSLMVTTELMIYIVFFHHMYKHNNNERLRRLLEPDVIRRRHKRNAITFFGQFCSFIFEFSFATFGICIMLIEEVKNYSDMIQILLVAAKTFCFACMSIVEVLTSSQLRPNMFKTCKK